MEHTDAHGLPDEVRERIGPDERTRPELVVVQEGVPQLQERRSEPVLAGFGLLLHELLALQRAEQAVDGGLRQPETFRQLGDAQTRGPRARAS